MEEGWVGGGGFWAVMRVEAHNAKSQKKVKKWRQVFAERLRLTPRQPCFEHIFPLLATLLMNLVKDTTETIHH